MLQILLFYKFVLFLFENDLTIGDNLVSLFFCYVIEIFLLKITEIIQLTISEEFSQAEMICIRPWVYIPNKPMEGVLLSICPYTIIGNTSSLIIRYALIRQI